jgi:hypothetical protein
VILRSDAGLVSIAEMQISRSQLRETFAQIAKRFGTAPVPVPVAWGRAKVAEARADNDRMATVVPLGFDKHRDVFGTGAAVAVSHPADDAKLARPELDAVLARSAKLHAEPELRGWLPPPSAMERLIQSVDLKAVLGAEAAVKGAIARETDLYFSEAVRRDYERRMRDVAISLIARGARETAADVLAVAEAVGSLPADAQAHTIPFLSAFFEKAFGLLAARLAIRAGAAGT